MARWPCSGTRWRRRLGIFATLLPILVLRHVGRRYHTGTVIAGAVTCMGLFALLNPVAGLVGPNHRSLASAVLVVAETGMIASIRFVVWGVSPFGALLAGWLGSRFGVVPTMWIGGVGELLTIVPIMGIGPLIPAADNA
ncbi:MAG: hypothetical protein JXA67_00285 [Micromonosporaceae bacterium]|nr:hypothetical protein [Micromonosporaceae bacterium]